MDALVLEDTVLLKSDLSPGTETAAREAYLAQFELD